MSLNKGLWGYVGVVGVCVCGFVGGCFERLGLRVLVCGFGCLWVVCLRVCGFVCLCVCVSVGLSKFVYAYLGVCACEYLNASIYMYVYVGIFNVCNSM